MHLAPRKEVATAVRKYYKQLEQRYLNGDLTLIQEIVANHDAANAAMSSPTVTLAQTTTVPVEESVTLPVVHAAGAIANATAAASVTRKRKLEDLDPVERMAYDKGMAEIQRMRSETSEMNRAFAVRVLQDLEMLGMAEERDKLRTADLLRNTTITHNNGETPTTTTALPLDINISTVTTQLGYRSTPSSDTAIGRLLARKYRNENDGKDPPKANVYCNGNIRPINRYTEDDRALMETCIHAHFGTKL